VGLADVDHLHWEVTMAVLHMTEAEVVNDIAAVLEKVRQGNEVVIEQNSQPVAVVKPAKPMVRTLSELFTFLERCRAEGLIDDDWARDVEEWRKLYNQPWIPPSWD
jgi:prevent-host-death family protein